MNFDDMIEENFEGRGGFSVAVSYEPFPKPEYLKLRDNLMIAFGAQWPDPHPEDAITFPSPVECGETFQWPAPGVGFDLDPIP